MRYAAKGRGLVEVSTDTFNAIEDYIRWAESVPKLMPSAMNMLAQIMAYTNQGIAQEMSFGPSDSSGRNQAQAWKIPVRRISQKYFYGWKVRRVGAATFMLYNDSREAYFIEFGIHRQPGTEQVSARRIRRPIRKLSLRRTLEGMMRTHVYHRVWSEIMVDKKHKKSRGFTQTVQGPAAGHSMFAPFGRAAATPGSGSFTGPRLGTRLPG